MRSEPLIVERVSLPDVTSHSTSSATNLVMRAPAGELFAVYFGYTACPDLCPATLAAWKSAINRLKDADRERLSFVFITVDPERDTAEVLNDYVGSFVDRYRVVRTTDLSELQSAMDAFLAAANVRMVNGRTEVEHTTVTYIVDSSGRVVIEWPFGTTADGMENDLKIALANTSDETTTRGENNEANT